MTDWYGVADMTPEEFKKVLENMTDRTVNFKKYEKEKRSRRDDPKSTRSYLTQKRGKPIGNLKG
mgnify:FL=1